MKQEILSLLVCPSCQHSLTEPDGTGTTTSLRCTQCSATFPVADGVPRFVTGLGDRQQIAESFGFQWKARGAGQFEQDTLYGMSAGEELQAFFRALVCTPPDLTGKTILDAGCGDGFLLRLLAQYSVEIIGIDINTSIGRVYEACKQFTNITILEADLLRPPFQPETFDVVWSEGVIVCTSDPKGAFASLARLVKPGGKLYVWVYPSDRLSVYQRIRDLLVAPYVLPRPLLLALSYVLAVPIYLTAQPYSFWQRQKGVDVDPKPSVKSVAFGLFDNLSPRYQTRHTADEIRGWFQELGFSAIHQSGLIGMSGRKQ